ncbi:MAG: hypothetical protein H8D45_06980 [Bacteroidetes bacterium]|nr:hypothetical protein [Bacteroidota bacterium]MBL7104113.1 hypothetical protein [Bacteroidales bacterium]
MKNLVNYIEENLVRIAIYILLIGILIIFTFIFVKPFNDWSFTTNSELFGQYGDFIGGFIGTLFSLVAVLLLYKTLTTQQKTLARQDVAIHQQKQNSEIERFETTFFNLLKTQQEITDSIKSYYYSLNDNITTITYTFQGREFFAYSKSELWKIWKVIENDEYLGAFDEDYTQYIHHEIEQLYDPNSPSFISDIDAKYEEQAIINKEKLKLANKQYKISKKYWEQVHKFGTKKKLEVIYGLFFQRYHYVIGHYYRHLYHIVIFVEQFEKSRPEFKGMSKRYIDFIQAQMSSYEMMLLFYNAISFPKLLKLLIDYNFLENLAVEDLIDKSHNCIDGIKLKTRKKLLGFE